MVPLLGPFHTMNAASSVPPPPTMATGPLLSVSSVAVMMYAPDRLSLPPRHHHRSESAGEDDQMTGAR